MTAHQPSPVLDVVVPVFNEERTVEACVRRLHAHLVQTFPYPFRITVADSASTDSTWAGASRLTHVLPGVAAVHLSERGRGRALRQVWLASDAPILAYMDVDLSTDLDALWPLLAPLMSGHSDLAIGSRLARQARVVRGTRRELVSRGYNLILRAGLSARSSDAQRGFKAIRADVARELLPLVEDSTLVLRHRAARPGRAVWAADPRGARRLVRPGQPGRHRGDRRGRLAGGAAGAALARRRTPPDRGDQGSFRPSTAAARRGGAKVLRFAAVGVVSWVLQLTLFALLRQESLGSQSANVMALVGSTVFNTWANRR